MEHGAWSRTQSANRRERNSREKAQEDGWASLQNYGGVVILRRKITEVIYTASPKSAALVGGFAAQVPTRWVAKLDMFAIRE